MARINTPNENPELLKTRIATLRTYIEGIETIKANKGEVARPIDLTGHVALQDALRYAVAANKELATISPENMKILSENAEEGEYIDPLAGQEFMVRPIESNQYRRAEADHIDCAFRVLRTFQTIQAYRPQLAQFRKLKALDGIL